MEFLELMQTGKSAQGNAMARRGASVNLGWLARGEHRSGALGDEAEGSLGPRCKRVFRKTRRLDLSCWHCSYGRI